MVKFNIPYKHRTVNRKLNWKKYNSLHEIILKCKQKWQKQLINLKWAKALDQQHDLKQTKTLQMVTEMGFLFKLYWTLRDFKLLKLQLQDSSIAYLVTCYIYSCY